MRVIPQFYKIVYHLPILLTSCNFRTYLSRWIDHLNEKSKGPSGEEKVRVERHFSFGQGQDSVRETEKERVNVYSLSAFVGR